jgi:capsular polysaccharide transport system permease protein
VIVSFVLLVAIPSLLGAGYYAFLASDQFEAEFKFTVAGAEAAQPDMIGSLSGIPAMAIIQDTQIVVNHLDSRAAVEALERRVALRAMYSGQGVDWWSRFDAGEPIEKFLRYWRSKVDASIKMPGGLVEVRVRAFTAQDALAVSNALVGLSEGLVNDLNDRMNRDAVTQAQSELSRSAERLRQARIDLQTARNEAGLLDALSAAQGLNLLIAETQSTLLKLENEYATQMRAVSREAPQMRALRARIEGVRGQVAEMRSKVAAQNTQSDDPTYSALMTRFSELELERQIAERLYGSAFASLEKARLVAEGKRMYLNVFVQPGLPEEARFPKRALNTALIFMGALAAWLALVGGATLVRNHMG